MQKLTIKNYLISIVVIVIIGVGSFYPALESGKIIAPTDIQEAYLSPFSNDRITPHNTATSDGVTQYVPYRMFFEKAYREDGYIGWNPYAMGGFNMAGNTMALPGSWTTQLHRFFSLENAWNWGIMGEFLIAGIGMLTFLRGRKIHWLIAIFGAMAFMLNSQFTVWINHRWALGSFCWLPWVLWAGAGVFEGKVERRHLVLPFFIALAVLGGSLQHIVYVVIACGCLVLAKSNKSNKLYIDTPYALKWSALFCLVFGLVAYSLIPQVSAYLTNIEIGHTRGGIGYKGGVMQIVKHIIAIPAQIWPWLMGDPTTLNGSTQLDLGILNIAYIGTIPMLGAMFAVFKKSLPSTARLMIIFGLLIPLTPLVGPLYHRVQIVFILGGIWIVCEMLNQQDPQILGAFKKWSTWLIATVTLLLLTTTIGLLIFKEAILAKLNGMVSKMSANMQFGDDTDYIQGRTEEWLDRFSFFNGHTMLIFALLLVSVIGVHFLARKKMQLGIILLFIGVFGELTMFKSAAVSYGDTVVFQTSNDEIQRLDEFADGGRVYQGTGAVLLRDTFAPANILSSHYLYTLDAYESIQYQSIFRATYSLPQSDRYNLSGVRVAVLPENYKQYEGTEKWRTEPMKNGFTALINQESVSLVTALNSDMPSELSALPAVLKNADKLDVKESTMSRISFEVPETASLVRVGYNYHPGWKWRVIGDDQWQALEKGVDSAIYLPVQDLGEVEVELQFSPRSRISIFVSLSCLLIVVLGGVFLYYKSNKSVESINTN